MRLIVIDNPQTIEVADLVQIPSMVKAETMSLPVVLAATSLVAVPVTTISGDRTHAISLTAMPEPTTSMVGPATTLLMVATVMTFSMVARRMTSSEGMLVLTW